MNNQSLKFPASHGRHISESDGRPIRYASSGSNSGRSTGPGGSFPTQHLQPANANPVYLHLRYTSSPQYPFQIDDGHDYVVPGISQPADTFSNVARDSGHLGPVLHGTLQPEALSNSLPEYPFFNPTFDDSFIGQGYEELQPGFNGSESDSQYLFQHGQWNNDAAFDISQPEYQFPNTALDSGFIGPVYQELQPELNHLGMNSLGTTPSDALGMDPDPFSNMRGALHMDGTQLQPAFPSTTIPFPDAVAVPNINNNSNRCTVCNRTFGRPQELRRHLLTHGPRNEKCSFDGCSRAFHRKDHLRKHLKVHERANSLRS